jgi:DNA-binding NarL/FixJ family response regulator
MRHASQDKVGIFLVAANPLLREALARALFTGAGFNIVGGCAPGLNTERAVLESGANLVLLDDFSAARSDLNLVRKLLTASPSLKVILVGMPDKERTFLESVRAGATGYVLHDASAGVLISAVRAVLNGEAVCPARMIVSAYKYVPGSGIAYPKFTRDGRRAADVRTPAPRALRSLSLTS